MEGTKSEAMASRSFRIRRDTLAVLEEQAKIRGLGITVYIRKVLESLVDNIETEKLVAEHELEVIEALEDAIFAYDAEEA